MASRNPDEGTRLSQSLNDCLSKRFVYDGADVLLELNPTNGVACAWINHLHGLGDTAYTHDANGNFTSDATFTYQYDLANQLTNVIRKSDSASVLSCRYDALGRRVDRYVYFPGSFLVLADTEGSGFLQARLRSAA